MSKVVVFLVILSVIGIGIVMGLSSGFILLPFDGSSVDEVPPPLSTEPSTELSPTPVPVPVPVTPPLPEPAPSSSPPPSITVLPPTQSVGVRFEHTITDISGNGLTRTVKTNLTNTGDMDAHNVWGKLQVFSNESVIKLDGEEFLRIDIGSVTAGNTVTTEVTLSFGFTDSLKILKNGAEFVLDINSDEFTDTFRSYYTP
ncbi:hypothetical protein ACFLTW_01695 [Chloroflexota bacterium]